MKNFSTVYLFEFRQFLKKKSTIITTLVYFLFAFGITFVPSVSHIFSSGESNDNFERSAYIVKDVTLKTDNFKNAKKYDDKATLEQDIKDGKIDEGIVFTKDSYERLTKGSLLEGNSEFSEVFNESVKILTYTRNHISYETVQRTDSMVPRATTVAIDGSDNLQKIVGLIIIYVVILVTYMTTILFATTVAINVVKEKANRAMELLLVTVKPKTLVLGKVFALTTAVFLQIGVIIGGFYSGIKINMDKYNDQIKLILSNIDYKVAFIGVGFAITGIIMLMFLYTAFASLVSRVEDVNGAVTVPMILLIIGFASSFAVLKAPDSKFSQVVSYIPFTSYLTMPARYVSTYITIDKLIIAYLILLATTVLVALASVRVYRLASLRMGKRLSFFKLLFG